MSIFLLYFPRDDVWIIIKEFGERFGSNVQGELWRTKTKVFVSEESILIGWGFKAIQMYLGKAIQGPKNKVHTLLCRLLVEPSGIFIKNVHAADTMWLFSSPDCMFCFFPFVSLFLLALLVQFLEENSVICMTRGILEFFGLVFSNAAECHTASFIDCTSAIHCTACIGWYLTLLSPLIRADCESLPTLSRPSSPVLKQRRKCCKSELTVTYSVWLAHFQTYLKFEF